MIETTRIPTKERRLAALRGALREGSWRGAARMISAMHPAEIASLIEALPAAQREVVWNFVEPEIEGDVLVELNDSVRQSLIDGMDADELLAAAENMELDDLADLVGDLPDTVALRLVHSMDQQDLCVPYKIIHRSSHLHVEPVAYHKHWHPGHLIEAVVKDNPKM